MAAAERWSRGASAGGASADGKADNNDGTWQEIYDKGSRRSYYRQSSTGLTQWTRPEELGPPPPDETGGWVAFENEEGKTYYHNSTTGATQWTKPEELGGEPADSNAESGAETDASTDAESGAETDTDAESGAETSGAESGAETSDDGEKKDVSATHPQPD